jgi:hypothetical protein
VNLDANDEVLLARNGGDEERENEQNEEAIPDASQDGTVLPNTCGERSWRPRVVYRWFSRVISPGARVAAGTRRARRNSMMTAMNCNYLEELELGKR